MFKTGKIQFLKFQIVKINSFKFVILIFFNAYFFVQIFFTSHNMYHHLIHIKIAFKSILQKYHGVILRNVSEKKFIFVIKNAFLKKYIEKLFNIHMECVIFILFIRNPLKHSNIIMNI